MKRILLNSIKTPDGTIITSRYRHDFVGHKDKNGLTYYIYGGNDYLRKQCPGEYEDLSVYDNGTHELRRKNTHWGVNYDKDMTRYPETSWKPIMDLSTDHIKAILDGGYANNNEFYLHLFKKELEYREEVTSLV